MFASVTRFGDLPHEAAHLWPDQTAITFREARLTFAELSEQVDKASRGLLARGVRKGDIVGI